MNVWERGFFEQGAKQSSTRLVGIVGFFAGIALATYAVVMASFGHPISASQVTTIGLVLTHSGWALKIRTPSKTGEVNADPPVSQGS